MPNDSDAHVVEASGLLPQRCGFGAVGVVFGLWSFRSQSWNLWPSRRVYFGARPASLLVPNRTLCSRYSRGVANESERSEAPVRGASLAFKPNQSTPANALAYSPAKGTNLGKERSGNDCQNGYTPFAALSRTHPAIPVASSPLFPLRKSSSRGERLPRWSAS